MLRSLGLVKPLVLREVDVRHTNHDGIAVPGAVVAFLSQFDCTVSSRLPSGSIVWEFAVDSHAMQQTDIPILALRDEFGDAILEAGASHTIVQNERLVVCYPSDTGYMKNCFCETGFGIDDFLSPVDGKPLWDDINSPERVQARLDDAVAIFDEMTQEQRMVITRISATAATLKAVGQYARTWAQRWAERTWEYALKHSSVTSCPIDMDAIHFLSKKECFRLAKDHGIFQLGTS